MLKEQTYDFQLVSETKSIANVFCKESGLKQRIKKNSAAYFHLVECWEKGKKGKIKFISPTYPSLTRALVNNFYDVQEVRKSVDNRIRGLSYHNIITEEEIENYNVLIQEQIEGLEKIIKKQISESLEDYPIWTGFLKHVKGVGPGIAAGIISYTGDIERFSKCSAYYKYTGWACTPTGEIMKRKKGQQSNWNSHLKQFYYLFSDSVLRLKDSPYRIFWDECKIKIAEKHPDWAKGKVHNTARRKTIRLFASHVFEMWYAVNGKKPPTNYEFSILQHENKLDPLDFIEDEKIKD